MSARMMDDSDNFSPAAAEAEKWPCARCGGKSDIAISFKPKDPEAFGCPPGQQIFVGLCAACFNEGRIDIDFLEEHLKYAGIKKDAAALMDEQIQHRGE